MSNQSTFPPDVEERFAAMKARLLRPPIDDWLKRNKPRNSLRLGQYFPTLEKLFDRGEIAYNNEDWRSSWQDCFKVAEFIFALKRTHNGWKDKKHQKETYRMIQQVLPKCLSYAEQCQVEIKHEIAMQIEAELARAQYQQEHQMEMERERARQSRDEAERRAALLREEARRAQEQGEEERASLANAQAEEAAQAAEAAAGYLAVPVVSVGGEDLSPYSDADVVIASVVDMGEIGGEVPLASPPSFQVTEGQQVSYQKNNCTLSATIIQIHHDKNEEYYTILLPGGIEKQTTRQYLRPFNAEPMTAQILYPSPNGDPPSAPSAPSSSSASMTNPPPAPAPPVDPSIDFSELGVSSAGGGSGGAVKQWPPPPTNHQAPPPKYQPRGGGITNPTNPPPPPPRTTGPRSSNGPLYGQVQGPSSTAAMKRRPPSAASASVGGWTVNTKCDIQDRFQSRYTKRMVTQWRRGQILAINRSKVLVTFFSWGHEHDIWINMSKESQRIQPYGSMTAEVEKKWQGRTLTFHEQMQQKGYRVVTMKGDGNCLFRAVAHQVWGDAEAHAMVRVLVCNFMLANRDQFAEVLGALVPGPNGFERYVEQMRRPCFQGNGEWGGDPEIRVMEEIFDRPFELWDVDRGAQGPANIANDNIPKDYKVEPIRISYHGKNHYNSVRNMNGPFPLGELRTMIIRNFRKRTAEPRKFDTGYK